MSLGPSCLSASDLPQVKAAECVFGSHRASLSPLEFTKSTKRRWTGPACHWTRGGWAARRASSCRARNGIICVAFRRLDRGREWERERKKEGELGREGDGDGEGEGEMPDINIQRLGREERRSWYRNIGSGLWSGLSMTQPSVSGMGMTQTGQRFSCSCM